MTDIVVKTVEELKDAPEEYREAVGKLVISHAINELYGAQVFDEPAIAYAPTPYAKWLTCRVAMEEYGHHVRFKQLGAQMGIPEERMVPGAGKKPLSIFEFPLKTWEEFVAIKLLADLAEILQVEDLLHCTFHPLRNLARATMPEERFHAQFGEDFSAELVKTPDGQGATAGGGERILPVPAVDSSAARSRATTRFSASGRSSSAPTTRCARDFIDPRHRGRRQVRSHFAGDPAGGVIEAAGLPSAHMLETLRAEVRGSPLVRSTGRAVTDGDRGDAPSLRRATRSACWTIDQSPDWPDDRAPAEAAELVALAGGIAKSAARSVARPGRGALSRARAVDRRSPSLYDRGGRSRAWQGGDRGARAGSAAAASIHVAAGAAAQAIYQLAVARLAGNAASPFESKFRLYRRRAAGRWASWALGWSSSGEGTDMQRSASAN